MAKRIESIRQRNRNQSRLASQEVAQQEQDQKGYSGSARDPFTSASRDNYQIYPYDYFSGADCKIFFGDIWVDDIITLQWDVSQRKTPIYGYASQYFDAIAKGQVIVQGSMSVSFKEVGYLNLIQSVINAQQKNSAQVIRHKVETYRAEAEAGLSKFTPRLNYFGDGANQPATASSFSPNGTPQIVRKEQTIENILFSKKGGDASNAARSVAGELGFSSKNRDFEDFAELLEDTIWGDSNGEPYSTKQSLSRADEFDYNEHGGISIGRNGEYSNVLNILLSFGDINDYRAEHTFVMLNDVHFVSTGMIVSPTGEPIAENYNFIAREINQSISSEILGGISPIKLDIGNDDLAVSRLEDIDNIEKQLDAQGSQAGNYLRISIRASLNEFGWSTDQGDIDIIFTKNRITPFIDQIIGSVERSFNDPQFTQEVATDKTQYIVDVHVVDADEDAITMVLEQGISNTRTYKVIAPTRSGFAAQSVVTREELLGKVSELPEPLDLVNDKIEQNKQRLDARQKANDAAQRNLEGELDFLGTADEEEALDRGGAQVAKRQKKIDDDRAKTAIGIKIQDARLEAAEKRVFEAQAAYDTERAIDLSDRTLNRNERDRLVDINREYAAVVSDRESILEDNIKFNETQQKVITKQQAIKQAEIDKVIAEKTAIQKQADERAAKEAQKKEAAIAKAKADEQAKAKADELEKLAVVEGAKLVTYANQPLTSFIRNFDQQDITKLNTRSAAFEDSIINAAREFEIDQSQLTNVLYLESSFNPNAVSPTKAVGIGQFTPIGIKEVTNRNTQLKEDLLKATGGSTRTEDYKTALVNDPDLSIRFSAALLASNRDNYGAVDPSVNYQYYVGGPGSNPSNEAIAARSNYIALDQARRQAAQKQAVIEAQPPESLWDKFTGFFGN